MISWRWPFWQPRRTIRPTREGWWCLAVTVALGVTAMNTGNNLLYLLESMVLALIVVSGFLSEQSVRGVRVSLVLPDEIYAGAPCTIGARLRNTKRRRPSFSVALERPAKAERLAYLPRLGAGEERFVTFEETPPRRGQHQIGAVRVTTRFPFGLFVKASRPIGATTVLVYPRRVPPPAGLLRQAGGVGSAPARRRGTGHDLHDLRAYRSGDDPRLIHWRVSARTGALTLRELEAEMAQDAYIVLRGDGRADLERLELGLAEAAAVATTLVDRGARVGLRGPGIDIAPGQGRGHARRILTALALYEPHRSAREHGAGQEPGGGGGQHGAGGQHARTIPVDLG
jgi:uncharacterized protein (DUF58 family)